MASSQPTCFVFDKDEGRNVLIQMIYEISSSKIRRKFNLLRSVDEPLLQMKRRLTANIEQAIKKGEKLKKHQQKPSTLEKESIVIELYDDHNQLIDDNVPNKQAWTSCRQLKINQQTFHVEYNAPAVVKFQFPDVIMANTITTALADIDYGERKYSVFDWYVANDTVQENGDETNDEEHWIHVHRGPFCTFSNEHVNKFVRLTCLPRNSTLREGMPAEERSKTRIISLPVDLPMNTRHQLTDTQFPIDSDSLRIVSYNILANGYASSAYAGDTLYTYCSPDFLDHGYRKPLLLREILGYHGDIICLQECDTKFFEQELTLVLGNFGYFGKLKIKSESVREGEAIFYRHDRFRLIDTHDITIGEYLRESERVDYLRQRFALVPTIYTTVLERNTALQVLALQKHEKSDDIILVCNTHLYFHYRADVVRCLQSMIAIECINEVKQSYEKQGKTVLILWSGDFNANSTSLAFQLLFTGSLVTDSNHRSYDADYAVLINDFDYKAPIELNTCSNYAYTHYVPKFQGTIDYIFFDKQSFTFERSIPMPTDVEVTEFIALPSCKIPSDHLAIVIELKMIR